MLLRRDLNTTRHGAPGLSSTTNTCVEPGAFTGLAYIDPWIVQGEQVIGLLSLVVAFFTKHSVHFAGQSDRYSRS
ncbi:hypothetical protein D6D01_07269 [Aureobasidium pullulans]|uniref:Uncharacterized protein n=1 Tax=Aureobasidium pullulans TaxID=5580 RepID=A0A4V4JTM9_AURPU|nr:hypothetical protein D6D01_07269 [Aureobasidium pullulans]